MCRSPRTGDTGQTRPGGLSPSAGRWGITGQRAGAVTDAPRASVAVWPRPLRRSPPEQAKATGKWRDNIRRGGSRASQSDRITGNEDLPGGLPAPRAARSGDPGTVGPDVLLEDGLDGCGARNRAGRSRGVPAPLPGSVLSSLIDTHTTVAIDRLTGQHWRTGFDSASMFLENYSIRGQGIIERWT